MKAVILCAGYATRLYPLTLNKPKALLSIGGKPLLTYTIKKLEVIDEIDEIFVVTNNKFYSDFVNWKDSLKTTKKVKVINNNTDSEEIRLGIFGDLVLALEKENIDEEVLVVLGDNLFDFDLRNMVKMFKGKGETIFGLYDVKDLEESKRFGVAKIEEGKIVSFQEKPDNPDSTLVATGLYLYSRPEIEKIKIDIKKCKSEQDQVEIIYLDMFNSGKINAVVFEGSWHDIGTEQAYNKVNESWKE